MKKNILLLLCLFITFAVVAQKQQGLVRTIERPGQKSVGIKGATVKINEYPNALVSGKGGKFSFSIPGKKQGDRCLVTSVTKKGYTMTDKLPSFAYSANTPIEIVMVSNKQLQHDEKRIRDKALQEAEARYHKRIAELERQLDEKTISEEQYREQLQLVFDGHENFLKMIDEMARRYAMTDYKGISEINRQIQECIENAELERADSLINSKGDINQRNQELQDKKETIQKLADLHKQAQEDYETYLNDLAQDYYNKHLICAAKYQNDSAAYWLEQRAALDDTTNVQWQYDAGNFILDFLTDYDFALKYYQSGLNQSIEQYGEKSEWTALFFNAIGDVYFRIGDYDIAFDYYQMALDIQEDVFGTEHFDVATSYNNIGTFYDMKGDYDKALEYYQKALDMDEHVLGMYHPFVAVIYDNIGGVLFRKGDCDKALDYSKKALDIRERVLDPNHPDVAQSYNNIGATYRDKGDYDKALEYHQKALTIRESVLGSEHPDVAQSYNNIGATYHDKGDYDKALEYYQKALDIRESVFGPEHVYVANSCNNLGTFYRDRGDYDKALEYFQKSLDILESVLGPEHHFVAITCSNIGMLYKGQGDYDKALEYYQKSLGIFERILGTEHPNTQKVKTNIDEVKQLMGQ